MSTISLRLNDKEDKLVRTYAELHGMELSTFIRQVVMEKIEDEYDLSLSIKYGKKRSIQQE